MAIKTNAKIQLRHGAYEDFLANNTWLEDGEAAVVTKVVEGSLHGTSYLNRIKVGPGYYNDLGFTDQNLVTVINSSTNQYNQMYNLLMQNKAPSKTSLETEDGPGIDDSTNAIPSTPIVDILQIIWNKIRQVVNNVKGIKNNTVAGIVIQNNPTATQIKSAMNLTSADVGLSNVDNTKQAADSGNLVAGGGTDTSTPSTPGTVWGFLQSIWNKIFALNNKISTKANLASPALTGAPTAPTASVGTNNTQLATTAYVRAAIAALVASSPTALDTLDELAAALDDDPNFAATITNALAGKAPIFHASYGEDTGPGSNDMYGHVRLNSMTLPLMDGVASAGGEGKAADIGHVHPVDTSRQAKINATGTTNLLTAPTTAGGQPGIKAIADFAPKASPALTGTPTAPTAPAGTNNTRLATTAYVDRAVANGGGGGSSGGFLNNPISQRINISTLVSDPSDNYGQYSFYYNGYLDFYLYNDYMLMYQYYGEISCPEWNVNTNGDLRFTFGDYFKPLAFIEDLSAEVDATRILDILCDSSIMPWSGVQYRPPEGICEIVASYNNYSVATGDCKLFIEWKRTGPETAQYDLTLCAKSYRGHAEGNIITGSGTIFKPF